MISVFPEFKTDAESPEVGSTNVQPVMFDMDPFGGKKVPCTKYQKGWLPQSRLLEWFFAVYIANSKAMLTSLREIGP